MRKRHMWGLFVLTVCLLGILSGCGVSSLGANRQENSASDIEKEDLTTFSNGNGQTKIPSFDFESKVVQLNSGYEMPIAGLGTYALPNEECYNSVTALLENGGRLIDTASFYGNEEAVGRAIRDSGVPREEIFVITKLYPNQYGHAVGAIEESLAKLNIGYLDMMLLHHPANNDVEAYKAIEAAIETGRIRSAGISCYYVQETERFLPKVKIKPALIQNEIHPYYQDSEVIRHIQSLDIAVQSWYPLGGRGYTKPMLGNPVINKIAREHGKSPAQVILRWDLQRGVIVIPGSSNPEHIKENISIFDFSLTNEEMEKIAGLNKNEKHDWY